MSTFFDISFTTVILSKNVLILPQKTIRRKVADYLLQVLQCKSSIHETIQALPISAQQLAILRQGLQPICLATRLSEDY